MEPLLIIGLGSIFSWVGLMLLIFFGQKVADLSVPPWPETSWKLGVIALVGTILDYFLDPISWVLSMVVGAIVFWTFMVKWFQVDFLGAIVLVVLSWGIGILVSMLLMSVLA